MKKILIVLLMALSYNGIAQDCPDSCEIYIPNNAMLDGDCFDCHAVKVLSSCPFLEYHFMIFNRWGEMVFESKDPEEKFRGTGDPSDEMLLWQLKGKFCNNKEIDDDGYIIVLR